MFAVAAVRRWTTCTPASRATTGRDLVRGCGPSHCNPKPGRNWVIPFKSTCVTLPMGFKWESSHLVTVEYNWSIKGTKILGTAEKSVNRCFCLGLHWRLLQLMMNYVDNIPWYFYTMFYRLQMRIPWIKHINNSQRMYSAILTLYFTI